MFTHRQVASFLGFPPEDSGILPTYIGGIRGVFDGFEQSSDGGRAASGDRRAAENLASDLSKLQQKLHAGIVAGELFPFSPEPPPELSLE